MSTKGRVVIGSLKGNTYGLGKDIVADALKSAGFEVVDLGVDVLPEAFVDAAAKKKASVIAISISTDETVPYLREVVKILNKKNMRGSVKIVIGGNAASEKTRRDYAIDAYAKDAQDCVKKIEKLLGKID